MNILKLIHYPTPSLQEASINVQQFDTELYNLVSAMNATMLSEDGIGLAAPQIGKNIRLIIIKDGMNDLTGPKETCQAFVNPKITFLSKKTIYSEEGCLSVPKVFGHVQRSTKIRFQYYDLDGKKHSAKATGMNAIIVQHEIDHINATLILDKMSTVTKGQAILDTLNSKRK